MQDNNKMYSLFAVGANSTLNIIGVGTYSQIRNNKDVAANAIRVAAAGAKFNITNVTRIYFYLASGSGGNNYCNNFLRSLYLDVLISK